MLRRSLLAHSAALRRGSSSLSQRFGSTSTSAKATTSAQFPFLESLGLTGTNSGVYNGAWCGAGPVRTITSPATGVKIADVLQGSVDDYEVCVQAMEDAKREWAELPAPQRGEILRQVGVSLRKKKKELGALISAEMGKILQEGLGEVQEAIDIIDYAVGLSRQLNGQVIPSERPGHFMMERWSPLSGHVGIITAFNFPCAVFFWNAALSLVAGNTQIWKPADTAPLTAIACTRLVAEVLEKNGISGAVSSLCAGPGATVGDALVTDPRMELVSFTGSTNVGRVVSAKVASRFGKSILELGGNNAIIVMDDADLELAKRASLFAAVGTAGQRCTSLRRLFVHSSVYDKFVADLTAGYGRVKVGNPLEEGVACGPLHTQAAVAAFEKGVKTAQEQGGKILAGGARIEGPGNFVQPTLIEMANSEAACVQTELFAPLLYVMKIDSLDEAIAKNNAVPQGLSSALFTKDLQNMYKWTGPLGSDCGLVNVNIGTSGAEIGGAFGGEKETGGGRESGSDSWKAYMRRSTCTINHSDELPLANGIVFET